jgi:hypothetical protein
MVKRQLLRLEAAALKSHVDLHFLHERERQNLEDGDCRCYLARDGSGAITLFLALNFSANLEHASAKSEYSRSLEVGDGSNILEGLSCSNNRSYQVCDKQSADRTETYPARPKQ